jgi:hypothetical protein
MKNPVICFHTIGSWSGEDVIKLISAANQMYDVFFSYRVVQKVLKKQEKEYYRNLEETEYFFRKYIDHPMHEEFYYIWRRMLKDYRKYGRKMPPMMPGFPFQLPGTMIETEIPKPSEIYQEKYLFQNEQDKLMIDRIYIASPGGFSFTGIGEILKQIREFIKDLWFRNNQEKKMGDLEIMEKYLKLQKEYSDSNLPPVTSVAIDRKMLAKLKDSVDQIRSLERDEKLLHVGKHIDHNPK